MKKLRHTFVIIATLVAGMAPARADVTVERVRDIEIPMSRGGFLRGDLYRPRIDGNLPDGLPTIVIYFSYAKDDSSRFERDMLERAVMAGFAGLLVDIRGTGNSPGAFELLSSGEVQDGYDVVEWAAAQPWSSGDIALWGYSYPGITAAMVATRHPPHLKAIVPGAAYNDPYRDILFPGGIRASQDSGLGAWFAAHAMARVRQDNSVEQGIANVLDAGSHPDGLGWLVDGAPRTLYDGWYAERTLHAEDIQVPALFWSGWDDVYPRGQVLNYALTGSEHKALVMGPWGHIGGAVGDALDFFIDESLRWFDIFLRTPDLDERAAKLDAFPKVRLFDVDWTLPVTYDGAYHGTWRAFESWPSTTATTLALCTGAATEVPEPWVLQGVLADGCSSDGEIPVAGVPVEGTGGISVTHDTAKGDWANPINDPKDQRLALAGTVLATDVLPDAVTVTGPMVADLWATSASVDADWALRVVDIGPDGARVMAQGWLRASHRAEDAERPYLWHTHTQEDLLEPREPYRFRVEIWPTSYVVPAGHRIGLVVHSADTAKVLAQNAGPGMLLVGPSHPSVLTIPIR